METRTEKATLTLTPSEREDVVLVASLMGWSVSRTLRNITVEDIVKRAHKLRELGND